ncbi:MAG: ferredoxin [Dehalococcoidia bacterium]|nr:ferredoxin [Dehalococcoidia bacterium]
MNSSSRCTVTLLPDKRQRMVPEGTLLQDAVRQAGIDADIPCGGQGRCGRCLVRIEKGQVWRRPNAHLTSQQIALGWALSCQTEVRGDVTALLFPEKVRERFVVSGTASLKVPRRVRPPRDPVISQYLLELPPPSLKDNLADLERLRRALASASGVKNLEIDLSVARGIHQTLVEGSWKATAVVEHALSGGSSRLVALRPGDAVGTSLGLAIDIGTTTVKVVLVNLRSGRIIDTASAFNRQMSCGEDVISRIVYSQRGDGVRHLQRLVRETINGLIAEVCALHELEPEHIDHVVVAGNTIMIHLFLSMNSRPIREEPYAPMATSFPAVSAPEVGLRVNPRASVYCVPAVAAYVGGDITAGILGSRLHQREGLALFMDVGTNGEIVLGNSDWMAACACSAGPAFEGAGVECGMRATNGAIEDVTINYHTLEPKVRVIGGGAPQGICGSGMLAALAEMFVTGIVDKVGRVNTAIQRGQESGRRRIVDTSHGPAYVLAWASESDTGQDILLTEVDINNLIRTKGAIYAGVGVMLRGLGIDARDIDAVLIGGAFGQHLNVEKSIIVGLLPDLPWDKFHFLGNTAALGAYQVLISRRMRRKVEEIAHRVTYLELVADNSFMNEFISNLFLPHTDIDEFPSVKEVLAQASLNNTQAVAVGERGGR